MTDRPFAVFDIDGTLIRWQLYHALADELARRGGIKSEQFEKVKAARMDWKKREASFTAYEQTLIELVDEAITHIRTEELQAACRQVISVYKDQVYIYTRDLIRDLKAKNYLIFAISASQAEIVSLLAEYYEFDDYGGSYYEEEGNGYFTGRKELMLGARKPAYLQTLIEKHGATREGSIAVGDSEGDIPMLSAVENPIAFNPTRRLLDHATRAGWQIVVERKDTIYTLESHENSYRLSK